MIATLQVLTADERAEVHERTLRILADVGMRVDEATRIVRFPPRLVERSLALAPKRFSLGGRDPGFEFPLNVGETTLLNGAGGITYYCFGDFTDSPLDFYYHAKALAELRPYEDLVVEGEVLDAEGSNPGLTYSALRRGGELLLLVGNYRNAEPRTVFPIPFKTVAEIKDLRSDERVQSGSSFAFDVPKGDIRLFYIRQ